jgi:YfiR/HmsC-like
MRQKLPGYGKMLFILHIRAKQIFHHPMSLFPPFLARLVRTSKVVFVGVTLTLTFGAQAMTMENWVVSAVRFTIWPSEATSPRWRICQPVGETPLLLSSEIVRGRGFEVTAVATPRETGPCDVFVASAQEPLALDRWFTSLHARPVLSIGMGADFCAAGGSLCLARSPTGATAFLLNRPALSAVGFRTSSFMPQHVVSKSRGVEP